MDHFGNQDALVDRQDTDSSKNAVEEADHENDGIFVAIGTFIDVGMFDPKQNGENRILRNHAG